MNGQISKPLMQKTGLRSQNSDSIPVRKSANSFKNPAGVIFLVALLVGGGLFLMGDNKTSSQIVKKNNIINIHKAEFVKNILILSDSEFEQVKVQEKLTKNTYPLQVVDEQTPVIERHISNTHDHSQDQTVATESVIDYSEESEQIKAHASEALSLSYSERVESAHQDERDEHMQRIAENEARYKSAMDDMNLQVAAHTKKQIQPIPMTPYRLMMKKSYIVPESPEFGLFKGAITKCYIKGHDMHWINPSGWILKHVDKTEPVTGNVLLAREIINSGELGLVVSVYENGYEIYDLNGTLISSGNRK